MTDTRETNALSAERANAPHSFDALILSSFGGPEGQEDVIPFLRNVTRGRGIPDERLEEVATHYRANGGVSPINAQNRALRDALEAELRRRGVELPVLLANRNWDPYVADVLRESHERGYRDLLVLATSAYSGYSSCRQYREDYGVGLEETGLQDELHVEKIRQYYDSEGFLRPYATKLRDSLLALRERTDGPVRVLFTTHSVPMTDANAAGSQRMSFEGNSAYVAQHLAAARWIVEQVGEPMNGVEWELVYQSRPGPRRSRGSNRTSATSSRSCPARASPAWPWCPWASSRTTWRCSGTSTPRPVTPRPRPVWSSSASPPPALIPSSWPRSRTSWSSGWARPPRPRGSPRAPRARGSTRAPRTAA